jgi:putative restriction endonuclease
VIDDEEMRLRVAIFAWLADERERADDVLEWSRLRSGVTVLGQHVHVLGPQGIFKPARFRLPLSITTSPKSPYADSWESDGVLRYAYRGNDPAHPDNVGLLQAMAERTPLIYFHGFVPGAYLAAAPVFVVGADPRSLFFRVQADDMSAFIRELSTTTSVAVGDDSNARRAYVTATVKRRLHQGAFRERVVRAYRDRCALCRLGHRELLDAAHITPDSDEMGDPVISNGVALCKLHHAAFDRHFFAVRPDYRVEVRPSILAERDGPMLVVGLQEIHRSRIELPSHLAQRPDPERLARRYEAFLKAG